MTSFLVGLTIFIGLFTIAFVLLLWAPSTDVLSDDDLYDRLSDHV